MELTINVEPELISLVYGRFGSLETEYKGSEYKIEFYANGNDTQCYINDLECEAPEISPLIRNVMIDQAQHLGWVAK